MNFKNPVVAYVVNSNVESHLIVGMLHNSGIEAYAVEDQSEVSKWMGGTIGQFFKAKIWVDASDEQKAKELLLQYEIKNKERKKAEENISEGNKIAAECEKCNKTSYFPVALDGTTQKCSHCKAYLDVGELDWEDDFGEPEE